MQLRSGRRLVLPPLVPQVEQRHSRRRVGGGDGDGVDRISGLPEELLLDVLGRFECAHQAAHTSMLSHRWRGLWAELRELRFSKVGADKIEIALARVRPNLKSLNIGVPEDRDLTGAQISSLLRAADRVAPSELVVSLYRGYSLAPVTFELPSFASAASIHLSISRYSCTLAPGSEFSSLEQLDLSFYSCRADLGLLLPRCPRLRKLSMSMIIRRPIDPITVESKLLTDVKLCLDINGPGNVVIVAPELKKLVLNCHVDELTVSLSAPKMEREEFLLDYFCRRSPVGFGDRWSLRHLRIETEWSHRNGTPIPIQILFLVIIHHHTSTERSFAQKIAQLPVTSFSVFNLSLSPFGHDFGPLVLHLLRIRTSIQRLKLVLDMKMVQQCSENCDCHQGGNGRNEPLSLPVLEDVEIQGFSATSLEVDFLEFVFRSAPMLKRMTIQLSEEVPTDNGGRQRLHSMFEANASVKCLCS